MAPAKSLKRSEVFVPDLLKDKKYGEEQWSPVDLISNRNPRGRFFTLTWTADEVRKLTKYCFEHNLGGLSGDRQSRNLPTAADAIAMVQVLGHLTGFQQLDLALADRVLTWFGKAKGADVKGWDSDAKQEILEDVSELLSEPKVYINAHTPSQKSSRSAKSAEVPEDIGEGSAQAGRQAKHSHRHSTISSGAGAGIVPRPTLPSSASANTQVRDFAYAEDDAADSRPPQAPKKKAVEPNGYLPGSFPPPGSAGEGPSHATQLPATKDDHRTPPARQASASQPAPEVVADLSKDPDYGYFFQLSNEVAIRLGSHNLSESLYETVSARQQDDTTAGENSIEKLFEDLSEAIEAMKVIVQQKKDEVKGMKAEYKEMRDLRDAYQQLQEDK